MKQPLVPVAFIVAFAMVVASHSGCRGESESPTAPAPATTSASGSSEAGERPQASAPTPDPNEWMEGRMARAGIRFEAAKLAVEQEVKGEGSFWAWLTRSPRVVVALFAYHDSDGADAALPKIRDWAKGNAWAHARVGRYRDRIVVCTLEKGAESTARSAARCDEVLKHFDP